MNALNDMWNTAGFMPHGHCYLWKPGVLWLHVLSDGLITLSYYSIPVALIYFVRKRKDLVFNWMFILFAAFIFWCGTTHFMAIWVTWNPNYWIDGSVKAVTAGVSVVTAIALWPLIPRALRYPSPEQLRHVNEALLTQIQERTRTEAMLSELNQSLERRVNERTRHLEEFSYAVSHDLREPLRAMAGYAYLLKKRANGLDEECSGFLEQMIAAGGRMDRLISDLLVYARVGRSGVDIEEIDLQEMVKEVLHDLRALREQTGALVEIGALPHVRTRVAIVRQVFQNLLANAMKHGAAEGRSPRIQVGSARDGGEWRVEVADDGPGIPPEHHARIFKVFQRLRRGDDSEGTGIGLAVSLKIVESLGGRLWVESDGKRGTRFCFTLVEQPDGDAQEVGA